MILPDGRHKPLRLKVPLQVSGISVELQTGQRNRLIGRKWLLKWRRKQLDWINYELINKLEGKNNGNVI